MGMQFTLLLVGGLLFGTNASQPAEPDAKKAQKDVGKATVVVSEKTTITISPDVKMSIRPVKTAQGMRVRLEVPGIAIEAERLRVQSNGRTDEIHTDQNGELVVRTLLKDQ